MMRGTAIWTVILLLSGAVGALAQPVVTSLSTVRTWPGDTIVISGSGFSSIAAQNKVIFGAVSGHVVSATAFSIQVVVPPQATSAPVEVINISSGLSAKSVQQFTPFFSGTGFTAASFPSTPYSNSGNVRVFTSLVTLINECSCDFDGDNLPDIIAAKSEVLSELTVLRNQSTVGNLSFQSSIFQLGGFLADNVTCGDLNGDGKPELLVTRSSGNNLRNEVSVYPNTSTTGSIQFGAPVAIIMPETDDFADVVMIRDMNADGRPDVVISNLKRDKSVYIFRNNTSGGVMNFQPKEIFLPGAADFSTSGLELEDFNGDKLPDIAVAASLGEELFLIRNTSTAALNFAEPMVRKIPGATLNNLVSVDFDRDNRADLAATDYLNNRIILIPNTSTAGILSVGAEVFIASGQLPDGLDAGDVNGDSFPDIVVACRNEAKVSVFIGQGTSTFTRVDLTTARKNRSIHLGDLDGDAKPDISLISVKSTIDPSSVDIIRNLSCFVPRILNDQPLSICNGQTLTLKSIPGIGVTYDWNKDGSLVANTTVPRRAVTAAGTYTITGVGACSAANATSPSFVLGSDNQTLPATPVISGALTVCSGSALNLSVADVPGVTYQWSGPADFAATTSAVSIPAASAVNAGTYRVELKKGACKTDPSTAVVQVVALSSLDIKSASPTNAGCAGTPLSLTTQALPEFTYQWKRGGQIIAGATSASLPADITGNYSVVVSFASLAGCSTEVAALSVRMLNPPTASFTPPSAGCTGSPNTVINTTVPDPVGADLVEYAWTFASGTPATATGVAPGGIAYSSSGSFAVGLTVSFSGVAGCSDVESKSLQVFTTVAPAIDPAAASVCPDSVVVLKVAGAFQSYAWSTGGNAEEENVDSPGLVTVNTIDSNGCPATDEITIQASSRPILTVSASPATLVAGQASNLEATGADSYSWEPPDDLSDPAINNPVATPSVTRWYYVTGKVSGGCGARDSVQVVVDGEAAFPNVFTPNGDGDNELWEIKGASAFSACKLIIFDRNGMMVYNATGYQNDWDGTWKGKPLPEGTYYYMMECPDKPLLRGNILLAR